MRSFRIATLIALAHGLGALGVPATAAARVVLLGVDGGSWNLIDARIAAGELESFAALQARGATGNLATVEPVNSPSVWTTLATGRRPESHGITHFYSDALDVRVPTVWERLAARGVPVGLYDYLVTWPARRLPGGFVIPGWLRRDDAIAPADAFERASREPYAYSLDGVRSHDEILANCRRELAEKPDRFVALLDAFDPSVGAVTFYALDAASHRFWDDSFPQDFGAGQAKPDPRYDGAIQETLRGVDAAVGRIAAALGPEDTLLIASDHGFQADPDGVRRVWNTDVEAWIARSGLEPERDGFEISAGFAFVIFRVLPGPFERREATLNRLTQVLESARSPAGDPLYAVELLDVAERPPEARRSLLGWLRQLRVRLFLWWIGVSFGKPAHAYLFGVPQGDVLDPLWPGGTVRLGDRTLPLVELAHADDFSGTHHPTGIFLAAGPPIRHLTERVEISVLDLAPLLFYLAGQPIPDDLDGVLPEQVIAPEYLAAHAPRRAAAAEMPGLEARGAAAEGGDDAEITERLRSLGYVE